MVGLRRSVWLAVVVWFAACGGRTFPLDEDTEGFDVGGQRSAGGASGRAGSGGQAGWWQGGGWNVGGWPWPAGGSSAWYGGYPNVRTGGTRGYGGFPVWPTGGFGPGEGGAPTITDGGIPWDALPLRDGGPGVDCVICASDHCRAQIDTCVATSVCLGGVFCAILRCQPSQYDCMLGCFGNDIAALTAGINAATCMVTQCGPDCVSSFVGLN
jgi:hypothetical protein